MQIDLNVIGGATWVLNVDNKFKIACDPVLAPINTEYNSIFLKSKRIKSPVYDESTFQNVKVWLITHNHFDHVDTWGLKKILKKDCVVSNKNSYKLLNKTNNENTIILDWYETQNLKIQDITLDIQAMPAFHGNNFFTRNLMGKVNGYLLKIRNNDFKKTIYITSDTVFSNSIAKNLKNQDIDILIANMGQVKSKMWGGPLTMDISMLNRFIGSLNPEITIPIHIDDFSHYESSVEMLKENNLEIIENGSLITL